MFWTEFFDVWNCYPSLLGEVSHDAAKWNEKRETSAGFWRVSYHACGRVSLTTSDVFVTCDTNGPIRVEGETTLRAAVVEDRITSLWVEESNFKANFFVLHESLDRRSTRIRSEIYWALWNCWFHGFFYVISYNLEYSRILKRYAVIKFGRSLKSLISSCFHLRVYKTARATTTNYSVIRPSPLINLSPLLLFLITHVKDQIEFGIIYFVKELLLF